MAAARSRAPEFPEGLEWFNVDSPVKLAGQRGRVVLLNFGTFGSVHCQQVLADLNYLCMKYRDHLVIINVNSPRFPAEMRRSHVQQSIHRHHVSYPVLHDPELKLWKTYGIKVWPTQVLIDHDGYILGGMSGAGTCVCPAAAETAHQPPGHQVPRGSIRCGACGPGRTVPRVCRRAVIPWQGPGCREPAVYCRQRASQDSGGVQQRAGAATVWLRDFRLHRRDRYGSRV